MIVYLITNKQNGKQYVGQTTGCLSTRWRKHKNQAYAGSPWLLHRAIRFYGDSNFELKILNRCDSKQELDFLEQYWILWLGTSIPNFGYNMTLGGEGTLGRRLSFETRLKISKTRKERKIPGSMTGRKHSIESIEKMRKAQLGKKATKETREKMKLSHEKRKPISDQTRIKISKANLGKKRPKISIALTGKVHTEETKRKISKSQKKRLKERRAISWG